MSMSMPTKVGINGMGRIGRLALRAAFGAAERPEEDPRADNRLEVVHLNELKGGSDATAHLLAFDSVQGRWREDIEAPDEHAVRIGARTLGFSAHATLADIPWGDLHYRESPCPDDRPSCRGSPWGYGDDAWQADFFEPAATLLPAADRLFVRGNHESCARAGVGWFRYTDAMPWSARENCVDPQYDSAADFTEPYSVPWTQHQQWIVFDSAGVSGRPPPRDSQEFVTYLARLRQVEDLTRRVPYSVFLNHHPVLGFAGSAVGIPRPGHPSLQSVMGALHPGRLFAAGVQAVISGHYHVHETLDFSSGHPASMVVGNAGSALEGFIDPERVQAAQPAPGAQVKNFHTHPGFGFASLDWEQDRWLLRVRAVSGKVLQTCFLAGSTLECGPLAR